VHVLRGREVLHDPALDEMTPQSRSPNLRRWVPVHCSLTMHFVLSELHQSRARCTHGDSRMQT
jgi:hypothetical protein